MAATTSVPFTIFRDDAPPSPSASDIVPPSPIRVVAHLNATSLITFNPDKENLDPKTGLRIALELTGKKRKTNVLATKLYAPPPSKKVKASKDTKKSAVQLTSATKATNKEKKPKKVLTSKRNGAGPSRARRSPSLLRVAEQTAVAVERLPSTQAEIDSRCYELTVLPLADVSEAYEAVPLLQTAIDIIPKQAKEEVSEDKPNVVIQAPRGASRARAASQPSSRVLRSASRASSTAHTSAATSPVLPPQRKQVYPSFTFSSPSASGERYAAIKGSASPERFSDAVRVAKH